MKFFLSILLSALLAYACALYLPWWSIALATFTVALIIVQNPLASFLAGFVSLFLLWLFLAVRINALNDGILATRISMIMGFGPSTFTLVLITSVIGAVTGGLGALTGTLFLQMVNRR